MIAAWFIHSRYRVQWLVTGTPCNEPPFFFPWGGGRGMCGIPRTQAAIEICGNLWQEIHYERRCQIHPRKKTWCYAKFYRSKYFLNFSQVSKPTDFCTYCMFQMLTKLFFFFWCSQKLDLLFSRNVIHYNMSFSHIFHVCVFACDSESLKFKYMFATGFVCKGCVFGRCI